MNNCFLYSKINPLLIKREKFELIIFGNPVILNSTCRTTEWIYDLINQLGNPDLDLDRYLPEKLRSTSGLFLIILITGNKFTLVSDCIRSFPIFYGYNNKELFITDNLIEFQKENGRLGINTEKFEEFLSTGLVYRNGTLYKNVFGLQAAEIVTIKKQEIRTKRYFIFKPAEKFNQYLSITEFSKTFNDLFLSAFSRMIENTKDVNNWIIPLSGGHDSRIIANYLYRLGVKNVICFSYGTVDNKQSQISKRVAEALGYEWYFVEYTGEKWKEFFNSGVFTKYIEFATNGVSTPHIQDLLAVHELKTSGVLMKGDVFLPGHTVVTETVFNRENLVLNSKDEALKFVYSKVTIMKKGSRIEPAIYDPLREIYNELEVFPKYFMAICDWQERQSKYITNSIKVYDFFGFESRQPMWDMELVDFWLKIPEKERMGRDPLYYAEKNGGLVGKLIDIPYTKEHRTSLRSVTAKILRKTFPESIIIFILRLTGSTSRLNEGLNHAFEFSAESVKELLAPIEDFPQNTINTFNHFLHRLPSQMDPYILTALYAARRVLDKSKSVKD